MTGEKDLHAFPAKVTALLPMDRVAVRSKLRPPVWLAVPLDSYGLLIEQSLPGRVLPCLACVGHIVLLAGKPCSWKPLAHRLIGAPSV